MWSKKCPRIATWWEERAKNGCLSSWWVATEVVWSAFTMLMQNNDWDQWWTWEGSKGCKCPGSWPWWDGQHSPPLRLRSGCAGWKLSPHCPFSDWFQCCGRAQPGAKMHLFVHFYGWHHTTVRGDWFFQLEGLITLCSGSKLGKLIRGDQFSLQQCKADHREWPHAAARWPPATPLHCWEHCSPVEGAETAFMTSLQ